MLIATAPRNACELARSRDGTLETLRFLYLPNRGILITPFHTMLLACPDATAADVERFVAVFDDLCGPLAAEAAVTPRS